MRRPSSGTSSNLYRSQRRRMSGVAISEAMVAIENSAKYVFKVITSRVMGGRGIYPVILKNPVNPVLLRSTQSVPTTASVSKRISPAGASLLVLLPESPQQLRQYHRDMHERIVHVVRQCR